MTLGDIAEALGFRNRHGPGLPRKASTFQSARARGASIPVSIRAPVRQLEDRPASVHAGRLFTWLEANVPRSTTITFEILREEYMHMLIEMGWFERPWRTIAPHFVALTSGVKVYGYVYKNGQRKRLRVYPLRGRIDSASSLSVPEVGVPISASIPSMAA